MIICDNNIESNYYEKVQNMSLNGFLGIIRNWWTMVPPVFNETGYQDEKVNLNNLHIKFKKDGAQYKKPLNLEEWRAAFQRNGLDIKVEDREVEVMVFKKKETPTK